MREPLEIITEIKGFIRDKKPIRFPYQETILVNLLNELETTLSPIEEVIIEEPIVEEVVIVEEPVVEEVVEETVTEEPTVEVVAPKKTTTRKK
jgi:hypothetical protein